MQANANNKYDNVLSEDRLLERLDAAAGNNLKTGERSLLYGIAKRLLHTNYFSTGATDCEECDGSGQSPRKDAPANTVKREKDSSKSIDSSSSSSETGSSEW